MAEKRILLLMTTKTYRAGEFLDAASRLGIPIAVGSEQTHVLSNPNSDRYLVVDFHDVEDATDKIVEFARQHPIDAVISTDDDGVVLAAMASDALALSHNTLLSVRAARDKYQTRTALAAAGLRTPAFHRFLVSDDPADVAQQLSYPCVVKPLALSASRGVMRADDPDEFIVAFERLVSILRESGLDEASDAFRHHILVESFIPGDEVAVEGLLIGGELTILAIFDKPDSLDGPFFEETIYVTPSRHPAAAQQAIIQTTRQAVEALGLSEGPIHAELRVNEEGPWIIEVAPRSIGGYCSRALRFGTGTTLEELILQHALDQPLASTDPATPASGVMMIPIPKAGILCDIEGLEQARSVPGIDEIRITIQVGREVVPLPEGSQYLGFIFAREKTPERAEAALREAHRRLEFVIMPPGEA